MKQIFWAFKIVLCVFAITSCNPNAGKELITEIVQLKAILSSESETIILGDTLQIKLTLPDTVVSNLRTQPVQSLQRGFFAMRTFKVDTINRKGINIMFPTIWTSVGSTEGSFSYVLKNSSKPFEVVINLKPTEKGLYYFEVIPQPGTLKINGGNESNLLVNFLAINKHLNLVSPYFGGQSWLDEASQRNIEGFGVYAFRVN